jgi:hypothetical protein
VSFTVFAEVITVGLIAIKASLQAYHRGLSEHYCIRLSYSLGFIAVKVTLKAYHRELCELYCIR